MSRKKEEECERSDDTDGREDDPRRFRVIPRLTESVECATTKATHATPESNSQTGDAEVRPEGSGVGKFGGDGLLAR